MFPNASKRQKNRKSENSSINRESYPTLSPRSCSKKVQKTKQSGENGKHRASDLLRLSPLRSRIRASSAEPVGQLSISLSLSLHAFPPGCFFFLRKMAFFVPIALLCDFGRCSQHELETYLSKKHDKLLSGALRPKSYRKRFSMAIVDGFAVEMTDEQVAIQLSTNR